MQSLDPSSHLALALDVPELDQATRLIEQTREQVGVFKVGLELFTAAGPAAVDAVKRSGARCFLDLKLHDIPATMGRSVARAADLGADLLTVHGAAGAEALEEAQRQAGSMRLLAVTVLTSFDEASLSAIGFRDGPKSNVARLAALAWAAGVHGFVSSVHECAALRDGLGGDAFVVTPGIRPGGSPIGDQKRVATPTAAIEAGSGLLVVGRPIRDADDPAAAASSIVNEIRLALDR